ncbi:conserved Plasmodium protein, unknown function [Plasmodium ovale]|uniref:Uncharacterized protein n=2 Tax=Plasmodium ovale TaxID=36330 RepID=A0A1A8WCV1_PLAOA|nr:hypothetical protein, conserved [Plasmodium ovale curtisi]SCP04303.1 conserved Plasmodium protein, unknown function [Plasmodium ovale]
MDSLFKRTCCSGGVNVCGLATIGGKRGLLLNEKYDTANSEDIFRYKNSYDMSECYFNGRVQRKDLLYNLGHNNLDVSNICVTFKNNDRDSKNVLNNVIDFEEEVLIDNLPFSCFRNVAKTTQSCNQNVMSPQGITQMHQLMINRRDTDFTGHNINIPKKNCSHLYTEIVKSNSIIREKSTEEIYQFDSKHNVIKTKRISNKKKDIHKEGKKNISTKFDLHARGKNEVPISPCSRKGNSPYASSEFLSVISGHKSDA